MSIADLQSIGPYLQKLFGRWANLAVAAAGAAIMGYWKGAPEAYRVLFSFMLFLLAVDTITGIVAAWKSGDRLTSNRFGRTVMKLLVYGVIVGTFIFIDRLTGVGYAGSIFALLTIVGREVKSVFENIRRIEGKIGDGYDWSVLCKKALEALATGDKEKAEILLKDGGCGRDKAGENGSGGG